MKGKKMLWFTGDTHFSHANIIKYCNRPFENVREHDETLIKNWNSVVGLDDDIYHLGDFAFASNGYIENILRRLNGHKHLIFGNHDRKTMKGHILDWFEDVEYYMELRIPDEEMDNEQMIVLCHYAFEVWNKRHFGSWHLHGHSHGTLPSRDDQARYDVGVDNNNYKPVSYDDIKKIMTRKTFKPIDHHGQERK
jgi:calcineurin-like phosphoesterase family protein